MNYFMAASIAAFFLSSAADVEANTRYVRSDPTHNISVYELDYRRDGRCTGNCYPVYGWHDNAAQLTEDPFEGATEAPIPFTLVNISEYLEPYYEARYLEGRLATRTALVKNMRVSRDHFEWFPFLLTGILAVGFAFQLLALSSYAVSFSGLSKETQGDKEEVDLT